MDSISQYFREIRPAFLDKRWEKGFEIFYRVVENDSDRFLKFSDYTPENHDRIIELMESGDSQKFYIHETDLLLYYREFVLENLRYILMQTPNPKDKIKRVYAVCQDILLEYFVNIASTRILRLLEGPIKDLSEIIKESKLKFAEVFALTEKNANNYTHSANVGLYAVYMGVALNLETEAVRELGLGAMLYDVGKKDVPHDILEKEGSLTEEEFKVVRKHPAAGRKILNDMKCYTENILRMAAEHHEQYNGQGYPYGLEGEKISLYAGLTCILDVFDAMTSDRTYRAPFSPVQALTAMKKTMEGRFDQKLFAAFTRTITAQV